MKQKITKKLQIYLCGGKDAAEVLKITVNKALFIAFSCFTTHNCLRNNLLTTIAKAFILLNRFNNIKER